MANTQPRRIGEEWSDERIKSFLMLYPHDKSDPDFYVLMKAYQGMRLDDFRRFITFFLEAKRNINAKNLDGETILDLVSSHRRSHEYTEVLCAAGGKSALNS